jgi:hypothetical protein
VAVGPDQHDRLDVGRHDLEVHAVGAQHWVGQHAGSVRGGYEQDVAAAAQDAVQRGGLAVRPDRNVGHALAGPWPAPVATGAGEGARRVSDVDVAEPSYRSPLDHWATAEGGDDNVADPAFNGMADGAMHSRVLPLPPGPVSVTR